MLNSASSLRLSNRVNTTFFNSQAWVYIRHARPISVHHTARSDEIHKKTASTPLKNQGTLEHQVGRVPAFPRKTGHKSVESAESRHEAQPDDVNEDMFPYSKTKAQETGTEVTVESGPDILDILAERLPELEAALTTAEDGPKVDAPIVPLPEGWQDVESGKTVVGKQVERLRDVINSMSSNSVQVETQKRPSDIGASSLLSYSEWSQLLKACLDVEDVQAAQVVLILMKVDGRPPHHHEVGSVLDFYADRGLVKEADAYVESHELGLHDRWRDMLIKARLNSKRSSEAHISPYALERLGSAVSLKTYTLIIEKLLEKRPTVTDYRKGQAWRIFEYMRRKTRHQPDFQLRKLMILGEIHPNLSFELFTEMSASNRIVPNMTIYNSTIRQCATKDTLAHHAFRLCRQMLNVHKERPDKRTVEMRPDQFALRALMNAARRSVNLRQARWLFDQISRFARNAKGVHELSYYFSTDILQSLFATYTLFRPRSGDTEDLEFPQGAEVNPEDVRELPQSHKEVVCEVTGIWDQIVLETTTKEALPNQRPIFSHLIITPKLVSSYLAVHYAHSSPRKSYRMYDTIYNALKFHRTGYTNLDALELYARNELHSSHKEADILPFAWRFWNDWMDIENTDMVKEYYDRPTSETEERVVARVWSAMMQILAAVGKLDQAELVLRRFIRRYPPARMLGNLDADPMDRRTEAAINVPPTYTVPFLIWDDLAPLYRRAVAANHFTLVDFIDVLFPRK